MIVVWRITQRCNLACPFCEWDRLLPRERVDAQPEQVLRFARLLADYQRQAEDPVLLSWLGGEPTLWPPLHDLAPRVKDLGIAQSTTTNGHTLASPKVQALVRNFCELTVSVDGFPDFHDRMRGWPGGFQSLRETVMQLAAKRANRAALKLRVNVVLMRHNLASFADLCSALAGWGVDEITFNALGGRDRPEFFPDNALRPQDAQALATIVPQLRARLAAAGVRLRGGDEYVARIAASARNEPLAGTRCAPGRQFLFVNEHGQVAPCDFTVGGYGVPVNELRSVRDVQDLPARFAALRRDARLAACDDCRSTQVFSKFSA
jgi:MoaA/NifB/PqqE/SkfB family radical SAM enzyme